MSELIHGRNPVLELLAGETSINRIWLLGQEKGSRNNRDIEAMARARRIPVEYVSREALTRRAGTESHQGVVAEPAPFSYGEVEDMLNLARERGEVPLVVICDHIEDPHNLGAIIRSAEALGAHGLVIPKKRAVAVNATVAKSSAGAAFHLPVARVGNLVQTMDALKEEGLWVVGTDASGDDITQCRSLNGALALVIGSEGKGISPLTLKHCDFVVRIPMTGRISSLNASAAAAIVLYEIARQKAGRP